MHGECVSMQWFRHNDCSMIHGICGRKDWDKTPFTSLFQKLNIKDIIAVRHNGQLSWSEHVQHAMSCIKSLTVVAIPSTRGCKNLEICPNVWKIMSKKVTPKTEMLGESVFYVTWPCHSNRTHTVHKVKMDMMMVMILKYTMDPHAILGYVHSWGYFALTVRYISLKIDRKNALRYIKVTVHHQKFTEPLTF